MAGSIKRSPRTARVTKHLDKQVETLNADGNHVLVRTLFVNLTRRKDGEWNIGKVTGSAALPLSSGNGWRKTYLEHDIDTTPFAKELEEIVETTTKDCAEYEASVV